MAKNSKKLENNVKIIDLTPENISEYGVCGYKDVKKHLELRKKIDWYSRDYSKGLRIKVLINENEDYLGMIEYMPGEYAYRPVFAEGFMFIQCVFVGFRKEQKNKGYATLLIEKCIDEAKTKKMSGVAVVTRKGSFMAKKDIFLKIGFNIVEKVKPDFELLVLKLNEKTKAPRFRELKSRLDKYEKGLYIFRSVQCPYTEKNVNSIIETAKTKFGLVAKLVELDNHKDLQEKSPGAFGSFCLVFDGKVISHHPISNTRFENIMKKTIGEK